MTQAQKVIEIRDFRQVAIDFVTQRGAPNMDISNQNLSTGVNLTGADGTAASGPFASGQYFQTQDTYMWMQTSDKQLVGGSRAFYGGVYAHDALLRRADRGWWIPFVYAPNPSVGSSLFNFFGGTGVNKLVAGQPNMRTLEQKFYMYQAGWHEFQAWDANIVNNNVWPNLGVDFLVNGAIDGSTAGYWSLDPGVSSSNRGGAVVFEGITNTSFGMPGETAAGTGMIRGGTSHPKGLMLVRSQRFNFTGSGTPGNDLNVTWLWVDIDTGLAVGVLGVPASADSDTFTTWQAPSIDRRDGFFWDNVQFVADPDSSFDRPKGELHFFLCSEASFTRSGEAVEDPLGSTFNPTTSVVEYFQIFDFNPFNRPGSPARVHNRRTQEGVLHLPVAPLVPGGSVNLVPNSGARNVRVSPRCFYHPPSRSYVNVQGSYSASANDGTGQPAVGSHRIVRWSRDHRDEFVSVPIPDTAVLENAASYIDVYATTELNEPASGIPVYFRTTRRSTRAESFNGTTQGASPYIVARGVIDRDGFLEVRQGADVDGGGTPLVETTNFTVNYATGTLTPVGSWPSATIFVRYRHRGVSVTPGFGTLSFSSTITDVEGKATAILLLPDNLDRELVGLDVSTGVPF